MEQQPPYPQPTSKTEKGGEKNKCIFRMGKRMRGD